MPGIEEKGEVVNCLVSSNKVSFRGTENTLELDRGGGCNTMNVWHHQINGHEFEQTPGDGEGQESLACCSPLGRKELDMTEQLNQTHFFTSQFIFSYQNAMYTQRFS